MGNYERVKTWMDGVIAGMGGEEDKKRAYVHTYGVSQLSILLAGNRGLDTELAAIIGLLHDVYAYKTGVHPLHSHSGAEMVRVVLKREMPEVFSIEEQKTILSAIFHHGDKGHVHGAYDELLKDADVLERFLDGTDGSICRSEAPRLRKILAELSVSAFAQPKVREENREDKETRCKPRERLADIAEELAQRKISGERADRDFQQIIRYFPEANAFDELRGAWCAAFVYHCCLCADIWLPIRPPRASLRLACVAAWVEWATANNLCFHEKDGFTPERGDIVIYDRIIPERKKPKDTSWCDHIGIVLACGEDTLRVAEGNVDNDNISGIVTRKRDGKIGCFVRIPDGFQYDGWKIDYRTGEERIVDFSAKAEK